jgi:hypothetical protein
MGCRGEVLSRPRPWGKGAEAGSELTFWTHFRFASWRASCSKRVRRAFSVAATTPSTSVASIVSGDAVTLARAALSGYSSHAVQ